MSQTNDIESNDASQNFRDRAGSSPISRGGAGTEFENPVAAYYLALALLQAVPRGQWMGTTQTVRFQQFFADEPLDDLVVISQVPLEERQIVLPRLSLQMKRKISVTEDNNTFDEVLSACWKTFCLRNQDGTARFRFRFDRFGIVFNVYNSQIDTHYRPLLEWARESTSASDFFGRVAPNRAANSEQQKFVEWMRRKLNNYTGGETDDETAWQFFASLVFLDFDFGKEGSKDYTYIVEMLRRLLPLNESQRAPDLWAKLDEYATSAKAGAGSFDSAGLCEKLRADGFPLLQFGKDCSADLKRLENEAENALAEVSTTIGQLSLTRLAILNGAREAVANSSFLLLTGSYGVGKSALWKRLISLWREQNPALVLSGDDINRLSVTSWNTYAAQLGVTNLLSDLLTALGSGPTPTIFIDGLDRVTNAGARRVIKDLLRGASEVTSGTNDDGTPINRWKIVATARQENIGEVQTWLSDAMGPWQPLQSYEVPALSPDELAQVLDYVPRLRPLQNVKPLRELLAKPFMLNLLADTRLAESPEIIQAQINTEIDVCHLWWKRIVGLSGTDEILGEERTTLLLTLGRLAAKQPGGWISRGAIGTGSATALLSLQSDEIISRHPDSGQLRLRRDPIEEWVIYRMLLDEHLADLADYLVGIQQPLGLYRVVQLLGMHSIERDDTGRQWNTLLSSVERKGTLLQSRWREAILCAPLLSTRGVDLLKRAEPFLLKSDALRLRDLLLATRTVEVNPDISFARALAADGMPVHEVEQLSMVRPLPRVVIWIRLLEWMLPKVETWPISVRGEAASIMKLWQQATFAIPNCRFRKEIAEIALRWLREVELTMRDDYEPADW